MVTATKRVTVRRSLAGLLALSPLLAACERPGLRAEGSAVVSLAGGAAGWDGTCRYTVETRWATALPHILRLEDPNGDAAVVLSRQRAWTSGRFDFPVGEDRKLLGLVFDKSTVEGGILGALEVERTGDSLVATVRGRLAGRDTVPLEATCRVGFTAE